MRNIKSFKCLVAIACCSLFQIFSQAQDRKVSDSKLPDPNVINCTIEVQLFFVEVEVTDRNGKDIPNLRYENFRVFENKQEQPLDIWERIKYVNNGVTRIRHKLGYVAPFCIDDKLRKLNVRVLGENKHKIKVQIIPRSYIATSYFPSKHPTCIPTESRQ